MVRSILSNTLIVFAYLGIMRYFGLAKYQDYVHVTSATIITILIVVQDYLTEYVGALDLKRITLNLVLGIAAQVFIGAKYGIWWILILAITQDLLTIGQIKGKSNIFILTIIVLLMAIGWNSIAYGLLKSMYEKNIDLTMSGKLFFNAGEFFPLMLYSVPPLFLALLFAWLVGKKSQ